MWMSCTRDQDINLSKQFPEMFLKLPEEAICVWIIEGDHFDLYDVVNEFDTAILPCTLIGR